MIINSDDALKSYNAMMKYITDEPMSESDWEALSWITLIDRASLTFEPGNCRWAKDDIERASNLAFYRALNNTSLH